MKPSTIFHAISGLLRRSRVGGGIRHRFHRLYCQRTAAIDLCRVAAIGVGDPAGLFGPDIVAKQAIPKQA
jgi:hypothetical protein